MARPASWALEVLREVVLGAADASAVGRVVPRVGRRVAGRGAAQAGGREGGGPAVRLAVLRAAVQAAVQVAQCVPSYGRASQVVSLGEDPVEDLVAHACQGSLEAVLGVHALPLVVHRGADREAAT